MVKAVLLQKYLSPYRVPLFNAIASHPGVSFLVVYYGAPERRRKAMVYPDKFFSEEQCRTLNISTGYESNFSFPLSLYRKLAIFKPDFVICAPDMGGITSALYAKSHATALIIWSEATPVTEAGKGYLKSRIRHFLYHQARRFIVPGYWAETYIRSFIPDAKCFHAPNTIEEDRFRITPQRVRDKFKNGRLQITFSGSLVERKGIDILLKGFAQLMVGSPHLKDRCELRILGTGPYNFSSFRAENIFFEGFCEGTSYADKLKSSHLFLLPSLQDCNPLTVIEALFAGNLIVVSDGVGNQCEAVDGNGLVIRAGSVADLISGLSLFLEKPRFQLAEMAEKSLAIAERFTVAKSAGGFLSALLE